MKIYMFRTVLLSIIRSFPLYTQQWYISYNFADSLRAGSGWNWVLSWPCKQAVSKPISGSGWNWVPSWPCSQAVRKLVRYTPLLCVQWKTPDDGQRNCPKHVEIYSKETFEKLLHLVGFIIRKFYATIFKFSALACKPRYVCNCKPRYVCSCKPRYVCNCKRTT